MSVELSGWRKRQIALDQKAENARELGLDYEPNKTVIEMARQAGFMAFEYPALIDKEDLKKLESFAALVREDEREMLAQPAHDGLPQAIPFVTPEELEELLKNS